MEYKEIYNYTDDELNYQFNRMGKAEKIPITKELLKEIREADTISKINKISYILYEILNSVEIRFNVVYPYQMILDDMTAKLIKKLGYFEGVQLWTEFQENEKNIIAFIDKHNDGYNREDYLK